MIDLDPVINTLLVMCTAYTTLLVMFGLCKFFCINPLHDWYVKLEEGDLYQITTFITTFAVCNVLIGLYRYFNCDVVVVTVMIGTYLMAFNFVASGSILLFLLKRLNLVLDAIQAKIKHKKNM